MTEPKWRSSSLRSKGQGVWSFWPVCLKSLETHGGDIPNLLVEKIFALEINFVLVDDVSLNVRRFMDAECLNRPLWGVKRSLWTRISGLNRLPCGFFAYWGILWDQSGCCHEPITDTPRISQGAAIYWSLVRLVELADCVLQKLKIYRRRGSIFATS